AATQDCSTPIATNSWSVSSSSSATSAFARLSAATAASTCGGITGGTLCLRSTKGFLRKSERQDNPRPHRDHGDHRAEQFFLWALCALCGSLLFLEHPRGRQRADDRRFGRGPIGGGVRRLLRPVRRALAA